MSRRAASKIKGQRKKDINFNALHYTVRFISTDNMKKSFARFEHTKSVLEDEERDWSVSSGVSVHVKGEGLSYIFVPHTCGVGTVVHEAFHCIEAMLKDRDIPVADEMVAYHLGYLVQAISDFRWEMK
jgi:hypothetical protein